MMEVGNYSNEHLVLLTRKNVNWSGNHPTWFSIVSFKSCRAWLSDFSQWTFFNNKIDKILNRKLPGFPLSPGVSPGGPGGAGIPGFPIGPWGPGGPFGPFEPGRPICWWKSRPFSPTGPGCPTTPWAPGGPEK